MSSRSEKHAPRKLDTLAPTDVRKRRASVAGTGRLLQYEALEDRTLFAVSGLEQETVYLLNLVRHDPQAYQIEYGLAVDLSGVESQPPLAVNDALNGSSGFHAEEMATHDYFGHQSEVTDDWPNRMSTLR